MKKGRREGGIKDKGEGERRKVIGGRGTGERRENFLKNPHFSQMLKDTHQLSHAWLPALSVKSQIVNVWF